MSREPREPEALAFDPTRPFRTRGGLEVRDFRRGPGHELAGFVAETIGRQYWYPDGRYLFRKPDHPLDLVNLPDAPVAVEGEGEGETDAGEEPSHYTDAEMDERLADGIEASLLDRGSVCLDNADWVQVCSALRDRARAALVPDAETAECEGSPANDAERLLVVNFDGGAYWSHKDGSHRCITSGDVAEINAALARQPANVNDFGISDLIGRFTVALHSKLNAAALKYGWTNNWKRTDWRDDCVSNLARHVEKGDPLDVAAYAAFAWHHGWSTASPAGGEVGSSATEAGAHALQEYDLDLDNDDACEMAALVLQAAARVRAASPDGEGWRPIETAPRDWTRVLVFCAVTNDQFTAYFGDCFWSTKSTVLDVEPTHWRPLPPPPGAQPDPTPVPSTDASGGTPAEGASQAARDVLGERRRQIAAEGWTPKHDDEHGDGEMALAAACYVMPKHQRHKIMVHTMGVGFKDLVQRLWPWDVAWWKPKDVRSDLVRAGALILAEIERLDRAAARRAAARAALRSDQGGR